MPVQVKIKGSLSMSYPLAAMDKRVTFNFGLDF